ncbi:sialate O-acetylesterase [Ferruginibacter albus]|uniref:sialate O-acetylesterase n=1 Tax=Ferruginibacter albus TaxID=2875540 RepID=UPI001CC3CFAF|nr:sialate O-acetylesterase [Ferruginibacter albus]UAY51930.1 sialate O-acetylesterase [Ferruginibacter albus]
MLRLKNNFFVLGRNAAIKHPCVTPLYGIVLFIISSLPFASSAQDFKLANTLQDNMVIQQGKALKIWGTAKTEAAIEIKADWDEKVYKATTNKSGEWSTEIPVPTIQPYDFTEHAIDISSIDKKLAVRNILFGDVWLCSGQSNMDMQLKPFLPWLLGVLHYQQEIQNAQYPQIRLFDVPTSFYKAPVNDCGGTWTICSPATVPDFSAVAYFFARDIFLQRHIPIGLVTSALGATSCQAWTSRETLAKDSILFKKYLYPYDTSAVAKEKLDSTVTFEKNVRPTLLYNSMIYPLRNLQFKGILWYQGESNRYDSSTYTRLCAAMINNWRTLFKQNDLPFYYVQVAPYTWQQNDTTAYDYALFREAQANIHKVVSNTGMALTMDIADPSDIHPRDKQDVGYRLARLALANTYKVSNTVCNGPEWQSVETADSIIKVKFVSETVGGGLATTDGQAPHHFFIAGIDGKFYYANATIVKNEVWLQSPMIAKPIMVRYAFTNYPVTNFCNKEGFPAVPFRTKL